PALVAANPAPADSGARFVNRDPGQPRGELCAPGELLQVSVRPQIGLLNDIGRFVVVSENCARGPVEPLTVPVNENFEQSGLTREDPSNQLAVRESFSDCNK